MSPVGFVPKDLGIHSVHLREYPLGGLAVGWESEVSYDVCALRDKFVLNGKFSLIHLRFHFV